MKFPSFKVLYPHLIALAVFLLLSIIYCRPAFQSNMQLNLGQDVLGWKGMSKQSFDYKEKYGHFPLWTNSMFSGMPTYQIAMDGNEKTGKGIEMINKAFTLGLPEPAHYFFLAALFFYLMCIATGINPWVSMLAGVGYAFATYNPIIIEAGHNTKMMSLAYAPMIFAGIFLLQRKKYMLGLTVVAFFSTTLIGQNHLQIAYYTALIAAFLFITYIIHSILKKELAHASRVLLLTLLGGLIGIGCTAINTFPTLDYSKETMRGGVSKLTLDTTKVKTNGGLDKDYALRWSMGKMETFVFLVPGLYGGSNGGNEHDASGSSLVEKITEMGAGEEQGQSIANQFSYWGSMSGLDETTSGPPYLGAIICLLFICGLFFVEDWKRWWLLAASIFGILLGWGHNFYDFNAFMLDNFPLYSKFRAPSMAMVIPQFCFPLLGALALQSILFENESVKNPDKKTFMALLSTGVILLFLFVFISVAADYKGKGDQDIIERYLGGAQQGKPLMNALREDRKQEATDDFLRTLLFLSAAGTLIFFGTRKQIPGIVVAGSLTLLTAVDLIGINQRYLNQDNFVVKSETETEITPSPADLQIMADPDHSNVRVFNTTGSYTNESQTAYFHNAIGGYHPAKLGLYQDLIENQINKGNMQVLNMLNTRYFIVADNNQRPVAQRNPNAYGNAWLIRGFKKVQTPNEEMRALDNTNLRDTVVIHTAFNNQITPSLTFDSTATITMIQRNNDTILYKSTAQSPQFAVFSEIYYNRGWNAYLDGKKVDYARVNYVLRGMTIPVGNHEIRFVFEPESYKTGKKISTWSTLLLYGLMIACLVLLFRSNGTSVAANESNPSKEV